MKTLVTQTSIEAYHQLNLSELQAEVLKAIRVQGETCIADIAAFLNMERSTVAARLNELKHLEPSPIQFVGKRKSNRTGILSEHYGIRPREFKESLFDA